MFENTSWLGEQRRSGNEDVGVSSTGEGLLVKGLSTKDAMKSCRLMIMAILSSSAAVSGADVGVGKLAIHASWRLVLSSKSKVA